MRKSVIIFLAAVLALSCTKPVVYDRPLGLLSEYNVLSASGGSTDIPVFSNTDWSVRFENEAPWASIDRLGGSKSGRVVFDFEENFGRSRRVVLLFKAGMSEMTLDMFQKAAIEDADVVLKLGQSSLNVPSEGIEQTVALQTNLIYSLDELWLDISYPSGEEPVVPWIQIKSVERDNIVLTISPNDSGVQRIANVRLAHTDAGSSYDSESGTTVNSNVLSVVQAN